MSFNLNVKVTGCHDCPMLTYVNHNAVRTYYCKDECFGGFDTESGRYTGISYSPRFVHPLCKHGENSIISYMAEEFKLPYKDLVAYVMKYKHEFTLLLNSLDIVADNRDDEGEF